MILIGIIMAFLTNMDKESQKIYLTLDKDIKKEIRKEFDLFKINLEAESAIFLESIRKFINERKTMQKAELYKTLENNKKELSGLFSGLKSSTLRQARKLSYQMQEVMNEPIIAKELGYTKKSLYMWQAVLIKTCSSCIALHGTTKPMSYWDRTGHPKRHDTICDGNCQCALIPVGAAPEKTEIRRPIMVQAERIRRAEKKRGKKYSASYKSQIIGSLNNSEFRKTMRDLRKLKKVV
jgi:hypothetical protein